ncbi:hypothetical protein Patl1_28070 [Pistacia atlantica]|uniref:Uncharacterized protein n=1 Tax=Pistacia atlantica TaxID=434234 RepID=A0ACC1BF36_9ROSI|nr:hypothetical protein Patl1_28070 [Pistacia atlantica]
MRTLSVLPFQHCSSVGGASSFNKSFIYYYTTKPTFSSTLCFKNSTQFPLYTRAVTLSEMTTEQGERERFDVEKAGLLMKELRTSFNSGKTKSYEWRISQLQSIAKMIEENERGIIQALFEDLSKPQFESFVSEISMTKGSCKLALKELKSWMKPEKAKTSVTTYPSSAEIVSEPLGVVLVISTWNYPFCMQLIVSFNMIHVNLH